MLYSSNRIKLNSTLLQSIINPATISLSPSFKSKGGRLNSRHNTNNNVNNNTGKYNITDKVRPMLLDI